MPTATPPTVVHSRESPKPDRKAAAMSLYKYLPLPSDPRRAKAEAKRVIECIRSHQVYFATTRSFNDPFDAMLPFRIRLPQGEARRYYKRSGSRLPFKKWHIKAWVHLNVRIKEQLETEYTDKCSVLCLTKRQGNNVMWSHYANHHYGVCVHYSDKLLDHFGRRKTCLADDVIYQSEALRLNLDDHELHHLRRRAFFTKFQDWHYEEEVRVVRRKAHGWASVPASCITGVSMGLKTPKPVEVMFTRALPKLAVDRAYRVENEYNLYFRIYYACAFQQSKISAR